MRADARAMMVGVDRAGQAALAGQQVAQAIAQRAAASGFTGVAQSMGRVRDAVGEVRAGIGRLSEAVRSLGVAIASADREPLPQDLINICMSVLGRLGTVHAAIGGCIAGVDRAKGLASSVLQGGEPGPMLARLEATRQVLACAARGCGASTGRGGGQRGRTPGCRVAAYSRTAPCKSWDRNAPTGRHVRAGVVPAARRHHGGGGGSGSRVLRGRQPAAGRGAPVASRASENLRAVSP